MFAKRTNWPLEPNSLARALEAHRRGAQPLIDLTASNPTACGFAYPEREILEALRTLKPNAPIKVDNSPPKVPSDSDSDQS